MMRVEKEGISANRTSGNRWTNEELEALKEAIENEVTQLETAAALPHRSWEAIRKEIRQLRGPGITVPETGYLSSQQRIGDYLIQNSGTAGSMSFSVSENWSQRRPTRTPWHQRRTSGSTYRASQPESG